jgi:hypothetical protein
MSTLEGSAKLVGVICAEMEGLKAVCDGIDEETAGLVPRAAGRPNRFFPICWDRKKQA